MRESAANVSPTDRGTIPHRDVHDVPEVAVLLGGISERYVWRLIADGELISFTVGRRRMVARTDLDAYIARMRQEAAQARAALTS